MLEASGLLDSFFKVVSWILLLGLVGCLIMITLGIRRVKAHKESDMERAKTERGKVIAGCCFFVFMAVLFVSIQLDMPQKIILGN